jgi:uncharacterized protein YbjT (DUF2867 family)
VSTEKILVTGATGKVGRELVPLLLEAGVEVRAGTRNPGKARELLGPDVETLELNYNWAATYDASLTWSDRVFLVPPPFSPDAFEAMAPFIDWAVGAKVRHIVLLSGMAVPRDVALRRVEAHLEAQDVAHTTLRPNLYMQNFHPGFLSRDIREEGRIRLPAGDGELSPVDVRDVAEVAARALTSADHHGKGYTLTGAEAFTLTEAAQVLSEGASRPIRYNAVSDDEFRAILDKEGWKPAEVEVVLGLFRSVREGARSAVHPDVETVLGRSPRSLRDFAREAAAAGAWS